MIVDSSALLAILRTEPEEKRFTDLLLETDRTRIAAPTLLEVQMVAEAHQLTADLDDLLDLIAPEVVPFDKRQAALAYVRSSPATNFTVGIC